MKQFIKLDQKELEQSLVEETVEQVQRFITRKRMDLQDAVTDAKNELRTVSTVTSLKGFDPKTWVENRNESLTKVKLAVAELENFEENFKEELK